MDDLEKADEQVEDLDMPESEADDVKGGASPQLNVNLGNSKVKPELNRGGWDGNHNETLIRV